MRANVLAFFYLASMALSSDIVSSYETCMTEVGSTSLKRVPTSRSTKTVQQPDVTVLVTKHPTHKVTPAAVNVTRTSTKTSYVHSTIQDPVVTSTITVKSKTSMGQTVTTTFTKTKSQTSVFTTTISTPSGFLAIADTTGSAYPGVAPFSNTTASINSFSSSSSTKTASTTIRKGARFNQLNARAKATSFPRAVKCIKSVLVQDTVTKTKTGTTKTVTLPRKTHKVTVTEKVTSTLSPTHIAGKPVFTTQTMVSTITKKEVEKTTTTVTVEVSSTKKVYAACATNNMLGPILSNGNAITNVVTSSKKYATRVASAASSAQDCCAQCMEFDGCTGSGYQASRGVCYLYYNSAVSGSGQSANPQMYVSRNDVKAAAGLVVGNGPRGYLYNGGVDSGF